MPIKHTVFHSSFILFITVVLAFCSIVYELLLAQSLAAVMGGTILRYNTTIGIYLASLGFGAIFYRKVPFKDEVERLITVEILLSLIGCLSSYLIVLFDGVLYQISIGFELDYKGNIIQYSLSIFNYSLIFIIGFLSGFELPLLMDIGNLTKRASGVKVLAFDYLGSLIGAVSFPLLLLPIFGVFKLANFVGILNIFCALILIGVYKRKKFGKKEIIVFLILILFLLIFLIYPDIHSLVVNEYYLR